MLGLLPFLAFLGLAIVLARRRHAASIREGLVLAGVNTACWATAGVELLSCFAKVTFWPLLLWWGMPLLVLAWFCCRGSRLTLPERPRDTLTLAALGAIALLLALPAVSGVLAVPSNTDALSYHLPRQIYWMQQQHVGFFSTHDTRMLTMPPLAEYLGVQLMILAGSDLWVHSVQWVAYGLGAAAVSLIARELGLNARWQALTALLALSIPTAALQACNAKNDLVTAFLLCAMALFGLQTLREQLTFKHAWYLGASGGLLVLSKGTGIIFGLPVAVWILFALIRQSGIRRALRTTAIAVALAALITAGYFVRLYSSFDSPLARGKGQGHIGVRNELYTPQAFISNVLRNTAMHIATDSSRLNPYLTRAMARLHGWLRIDLNDPRTTFTGSPPYEAELALKHEDLAKAPVHLLLAIAAFGLVIARLVKAGAGTDRLRSLFLLMPFTAFFLFCLLLNWQVWHSRLQIPIFFLLCPVVALTGQRFPRTGVGACALAAALGLYAALFNSTKPWIGKSCILINANKRAKMQPRDGREMAEAVARACQELKPRVIGVVASRCEYTLLRTLSKKLDPDPQFVKINLSWRKPGPTPEPDVVAAWYMSPWHIQTLSASHDLVFSNHSVCVFLPRTNKVARAD